MTEKAWEQKQEAGWLHFISTQKPGGQQLVVGFKLSKLTPRGSFQQTPPPRGSTSFPESMVAGNYCGDISHSNRSTVSSEKNEVIVMFWI